VRSLEGIVAQS